jgi:hypothetical protein
MPWSPSDGPTRHTKKANTPGKRKQWSTVANSVLEKSGDEGKAVRIANAAVAKHPSVGLAKAPGE